LTARFQQRDIIEQSVTLAASPATLVERFEDEHLGLRTEAEVLIIEWAKRRTTVLVELLSSTSTERRRRARMPDTRNPHWRVITPFLDELFDESSEPNPKDAARPVDPETAMMLLRTCLVERAFEREDETYRLWPSPTPGWMSGRGHARP
jgi:hypothetical protein